ncbi:hypothetical protein H8A97_13080 [Bradyrhizobium sp. Arg62]|uniref:hypothetical protein n=1 Tax=Bradyrhizobium brasilense TaxID=1419277 RepID=UPI001E578EF3|nr:hypothetical protein [Bradyrhizobium brasilense]MCC8946007.1 hypothetical protein [Bradyrhizobium brasilense]
MPGPSTDQTLEMWAGGTVVVTVPILDSAGNEVELGGAIAKWWMGKNAKSTGTDVYITKSSDQNAVCDDGVTRPQIEILRETDAWVLVLHLNRADTETGLGSNPPPKTYYHEARVVDGNGNYATVMTGQFILHPAIGGNVANGD